jgi:hypothetical protein
VGPCTFHRGDHVVILIITRPDDAHAAAMLPRLTRRGVEVARFSHASFPQQAQLSLRCGDGGAMQQVLRVGDTSLDLASVTAVWYRRPQQPVLHDHVRGQATRRWVDTQCAALLESVWNTHAGLWFPGTPARIEHASSKALQLKLAQSLGLEIPPTLITNSPAEVLEFYKRHRGKVVRKAVKSADVLTEDGARVRPFTYLVSRRDLAHLHGTEHCPTIVQAYVEKDVELRVTVVGQRVFAAEIDSQHANHTRYDWRHHDIAHTPHRPHDLPAHLRRACIDMIAERGLLFGAIDMIVTPQGRYVFLELNPNGEYLWIESLTRLPISDAVCDILVSRETTTSAAESSSPDPGLS